MDTGCYVTERSWPLLSTQYAEQGPQRTCLRNRRCTHLIHGKSEAELLRDVRQVFERLRATNIAVNPKRTKLGLSVVEYVGHLVSATGTSFTLEKRLKVLDFPQPTTQKVMLQFIGLANYFRDHVPSMTDMVKPLRDMLPLGKYQRTGKLIWTTESSAAFKLCQQ